MDLNLTEFLDKEPVDLLRMKDNSTKLLLNLDLYLIN